MGSTNSSEARPILILSAVESELPDSLIASGDLDQESAVVRRPIR
jgi:hypothetical protein